MNNLIDLQTIMKELARLGTERNKKIYMNNGAKEPLFGVATGAMKPLAKKIKKNYELSMDLYATGNYDAAYLAGIIAEPQKMSMEDFEHWMKSAYFYMISDYIVAVTLAETTFAQTLADKWIDSGKELYMSAGWSCYCWLLGTCPDDSFHKSKLEKMLDEIRDTIHLKPVRTTYSMNEFVIAVGISYLPLFKDAVKTAEYINSITKQLENKGYNIKNAFKEIKKAEEKSRLGFKRKNVRC